MGTVSLAHSVKCRAQPSVQKGMLSALEILRFAQHFTIDVHSAFPLIHNFAFCYFGYPRSMVVQNY